MQVFLEYSVEEHRKDSQKEHLERFLQKFRNGSIVASFETSLEGFLEKFLGGPLDKSLKESIEHPLEKLMGEFLDKLSEEFQKKSL